MKTLVLDFSGVYEQERAAADAAVPFYGNGAAVLDFSGLEGTNCYCDPESEKKISAAVGSYEGLHWVDTGDYHYLSKVFLDKIHKPFCLVLIDHHPDEQEAAFGCLSCGSWVADAKKSNACLRQVYSVGPADRVSAAEPQTTFLPEGASAWDIDTELPVYLSVDLDALSPSEFRSDWDQGSMSYAGLSKFISDLMASHRILGIDVCGGKTTEKGAADCELRSNFALRTRLQELIESAV